MNNQLYPNQEQPQPEPEPDTSTRLLALTEHNGSFSRKVPGLQTTWDSTSIGMLKTCPRKYYLSMIEGYFPDTLAIDLAFGIAYHESLEVYDRWRHAGTDHEEALLHATRYAMQASGTYEPQTFCPVCDTKVSPGSVVCHACDFTGDFEHSRAFVPWNSPRPQKTRETLIRTVVWYCEEHKDDPMQTHVLPNGDPAIEVHFKIPLEHGSRSGEEFYLSGYLDKIVDWNDATHVLDRKTTKSTISPSYFSQWSPNGQMTLYSIAAKTLGICETSNVSLIIDAAQTTIHFSEFGRGLTSRTPDQLSEWLRELGFWIAQAEAYANAQFWPANDTACFQCQYREACSKDPFMRSNVLEAQFNRRMWDPSKPRPQVQI